MKKPTPYSELLHRSAEKWGIPVMDGRPFITDNSSPYPKPEVCEKLEWRGVKPGTWVKISLFEFNGQWGYALSVNFAYGGFGYGPNWKFSDPHPSRIDALKHAGAKVVREAKRREAGYRKFEEWLSQYTEPVQLSLF